MSTRPPPDPDSTLPADLLDSSHAPLEPSAPSRRRRRGISLFWRTFLLLDLLLVAASIGWYQLFRTLEHEPRVIENARQVASLVNLSRAALIHSDAIARISLIKTLADQEKVRILPREPGDRFEPLTHTALEQRMSAELAALLGRGTVVARQVNSEPGLWVGFTIEGDSYWFLMDHSRVGALLTGGTWLLWLSMLCVVSLAGAAWLAGLINRPLRQLALAAARVGQGDLGNRLDENALSREVREVNIGFNHMAEQLSKLEQDRAEMLAGISHDLRTPLARLRLETEMSVLDPDARAHMVADIAQVDHIIGKFLDYARPDHVELHAIPLLDLAQSAARPFLTRADMQVQIDIAPNLHVLCDEVELMRVLANLLENARRYGQSEDTGIARVRVAATARDGWITLRVRDHGRGVPPEQLPLLTRPFYRGDTARTEATGSGLGLAVVAKMVHSMGGTLHMVNSPSGGLMALIRLRQGKPEKSPAPTPAAAG